jgi:hypothetical protein
MGLDPAGKALGQLRSTGLRPQFAQKLASAGVQLDPALFAFERFGR